MRGLLTVRQVMDVLQVDRTTVYRMVKDGRLTGVKVGRQWRFAPSEVEGLVAGAVAAPPSPGPAGSELPLHCVQPIQDVFAEIAGVAAVTTDGDGRPQTSISNSCRFCNMMLSSPSGRKACIASWRRLADQEGDRPEFATCHAGLQYARARIDLGDRAGPPTAMLIAGQFYARPLDRDEEVRRVQALSEEHALDPLLLKEATRELPVLGDRYRERIGAWLDTVARTMAQIGRERSDLIGRLRRISEESRLEFEQR